MKRIYVLSTIPLFIREISSFNALHTNSIFPSHRAFINEGLHNNRIRSSSKLFSSPPLNDKRPPTFNENEIIQKQDVAKVGVLFLELNHFYLLSTSHHSNFIYFYIICHDESIELSIY